MLMASLAAKARAVAAKLKFKAEKEEEARRLAEQDQEQAKVRPLLEYTNNGKPCITGFVRFCREVMNREIWSRQREIVLSVFNNRRTAVRSGHSVGKTMITALICEYWFSCLGRCFLTTAPGRDAVKDLLWKQIKKNREAANRILPGDIYDNGEIRVKGSSADGTEDQSGWWGKGFSTNSSERAQGKHEVGLLIVADEAAGVAPFVWMALESSMASDEVRMLAIGNPNADRGKFYHAFHRDKDVMWNCIHISSLESPNLTLHHDNELKGGSSPWPFDAVRESPVPGLANDLWVEDQRRNYAEEPNNWRCRVLGEFPTDDGDEKVLSYANIEASQAMWEELAEEEEYMESPPRYHCAFGDVAGWGKDSSTLVSLCGQRFHIEVEYNGTSDEAVMIFAEKINAWVCSLPADNKPKWIAVDCDAGGIGCHGRLFQLYKLHKEQWGRTKLVRFSWGQGADDSDRFPRAIDEVHWRLREAIDRTKPRADRLAVPPGGKVASQLNLRKYSEDSRERKVIESKQKFLARGEKSPDIADAIAGCMYRPKIVSSAVAGGGKKRSA